MDFSLTDEQMNLKDTIIKFAHQELNNNVSEHDRKSEFPMDSWKKCAEMAIMALPFSEEYGGHGADFLTSVICYNALGYACKDAGLVHAIGTQILCGMQIESFGSKKQKEKYLPLLSSGEKIFAQAITEPGSGSDALAMQTRAVREDDTYTIKGSKTFISNGPIADVIVVFAVTDPEKKSLGRLTSFIIDKDVDGLERCKSMEKMGLKTLQNGELIFEYCKLSKGDVLGKEGQGAMIFYESMEMERCFLPAANLGTLKRVLEKTTQYAKERSAFGKSIGKYQSISTKIAQIKVNLELGTLILHKAATLKSQEKRASMEASIAKLFISESLRQACLDAVQVHGGYGFMTEYEIERDLRDSIASSIYSGTTELQYNMISRLLGL